MIGRTIVFLFLVIFTAEAIVKFRRSKIYDEFDFQDEAIVTVYDICAESCHIYASVTPDSKKFAANLLIQLPKGFVSVADVAAKFDPSTGQKLFLEINTTASLTIVNANAQMTAGPLVLYVVRNEFSNPEVYEAEGLIRPVSTIPKSITVMSARPFTLIGAPLDGYKPQGVIATMSGYDDMEYAQCPYLYYVEKDGPFPGFTWEVNGPIISLEYDSHTFPYPPGELTATIGITNKHQVERSGWMSSPGYHGCPGQKPYRSSLYDFSSQFHAGITSKIPLSIGVEIVTNADDAHPISITDRDSGAQYSIANTANGTYVSYTFIRTQNVTLDWNPAGIETSHFLARYRGFESRFLHGIV